MNFVSFCFVLFLICIKYIHPALSLYVNKYILHYITLHYITLHYITLHYITLHYITLYYIILYYYYITLYYIILYAQDTYVLRYILDIFYLLGGFRIKKPIPTDGYISK